jgi:hypothetical protein
MQQITMKGNKRTYLLLAALFFCSSLALYEDEIGLNDWCVTIIPPVSLSWSRNNNNYF